MNFGASKTPVEIIKEGAFEGTFILVLLESGTKVMERIRSAKKYWPQVFLFRSQH